MRDVLTSVHTLTLLSVCALLASCIHEPPGPLSDPDELGGAEVSCLPQTRVVCAEDGDLYWMDSCGELGARQERCPLSGACVDGPPPMCSTPESSCLDLRVADTAELEVDFGTVGVGGSLRREVILESCGGEPLTVAQVGYEGADSFLVEPIETPLRLSPAGVDGSRSRLSVSFTPTDAGEYRGEVIVYSDDLANPAQRVNLVGVGARDICPRPAVVESSFTTRPLEVITLDASPSTASSGSREGLSYEWVVTSRPDGSIAQPVESFYDASRPANGGSSDDVNTPQALFFLDLVGDYTFQLIVSDPRGVSAPSEQCSQSAEVNVSVRTDRDIHIELTWSTPGDPDESDENGTDVDLHLSHPSGELWNDELWDCHYANESPDWGDPGSEGNPSLDIDDTNGAGPENINLDSPEDTDALGAPYRIGVHYYSSEDFEFGRDFGSSEALIRVYLASELAGSYRRELPRTGSFWEVASIFWTPRRARVEAIDRLYDEIP